MKVVAGVRSITSSLRFIRRAVHSTARLSDARQLQPSTSEAGVRELLDCIATEDLSQSSRATVAQKLSKQQKIEIPPRIQFDIAVGQSNERRAYFANDVDGEVGLDWGSVELGENLTGLENGRVVECRRSGQVSLGLILASILVGGRPRLLFLRSSGEIWPVSSHDVQFVMPSSLIPASLAEACWSLELLQEWTESRSSAGLDGEALVTTPEMLDARRKAALILRRVQRETERMCGRLQGGIFGKGRIGGAEGVWEKLAPEAEGENISITAVEAAEYILNPETFGEASQNNTATLVKPNTLPAYAAHVLLMARPDMFVGDIGDMWATGIFRVRSRPEKARIERVQKWVESCKSSGPGAKPLQSFVEKASAVLALSQRIKQRTEGQDLQECHHNLPSWSATDLDILYVLFAIIFETRSTQSSPFHSLAIAITRLLIPDSEEGIDRGTIARLLQDMGMILPWDSLETSKTTEAIKNAAITTTVSDVRSANELFYGNELDSLRQDYTSHKVFVIDDPTASELDDGIALERIPGSEDVWVHIHVADPTRYIPPSHPIAKHASVRGSSLYLPEGNTPLFPLEVIMKELSLGAQVERDEGRQGVITFSARLSSKGHVEDSKVTMGWIKNPRITTYATVNKALGFFSFSPSLPFGGPKGVKENLLPNIDNHDLEDLRVLFDLASTIRAERYATAGLEWSFPTASVSLLNHTTYPNPNIFSLSNIPSAPQLYSGDLQVDYRISNAFSPSLRAGTMVAEYMVLAGRLAAQFCSSHDIPVVYRGSSAPKPVNTSSTLEDLLARRHPGTGLIDPYVTLEPGWYRSASFLSLSPVAHWIMGIDTPKQGYVRATSPLRRFDDMIVHWQIKAALAKEKGIGGKLSRGFTKEEVVRLAQQSEEGAKRAKRASTNAELFWKTVVINRHLKSPGGLLLPEGWTRNEAEIVDVQGELIARVLGLPESAPSLGGELSAVYIESLGVPARMEHLGGKAWKVGEEVRVKLKLAEKWPNPRITVVDVN
ncbi:uncharacterized protein L203_106288 [Cryptococcus depauperatus CBS 7841]|uniref:RNB domain-containing protein n=1 Tax=Cryptococcus depauperatus CBS 7841 TaxID=1295531 RepID=A0A1E3IL74_9TREE|nr:exoribonuclease II [Cryptococcus depauperatus CBS 7841]